MAQIKKIGVLTSGGDGPGMNAAIRSVTRYALYHGIQVEGIMRGYEGLIDGEMMTLNHRSVANIIDRGGTFLRTARSKRFVTAAGMRKAAQMVKKFKLDAIITIGGDGTYRGASEFTGKWNVPIVGMPGTIDNDLFGTDQTIGCDTALNTALDAIDRVRDTAHSMERIFVIEVMGNKSGYLAMQVALGSGAEELIIPERSFDCEKMLKEITDGYKKGKVSWLIVVAEGAGHAKDIAEKIAKVTKLETRFVVLGHVQRGGTPVASDRILATRLGAAAVDLLLKGDHGKAVGILQDKLSITELAEAQRIEVEHLDEYYRLLKILT